MPSATTNLLQKVLPLSILPRRLRYRLHRHVLKSETVTARVLDYEMKLPLQLDGIGRILMVFGERELDQHYILHQVLKSGDTVMDIGGNIGYYCSMESRVIGTSGKIYCFEPDIRNFDILKQNIEINGGKDIVEIFNAPVSDQVQEVDFHIAEASNLSSMHITRGDENSVLANRNMHNRAYERTTKLTTVDFWEFVKNSERPIDLVRMDIEGHEAVILKHFADQLEKSQDFNRAPKAFIFEPHSWEYEDANHPYESLTRLVKLGYKITYMGSRSEPNSPIAQRGYKPVKLFKEKRGVTRGVYVDIDQTEAVELAARVDGVTTICLQLQK